MSNSPILVVGKGNPNLSRPITSPIVNPNINRNSELKNAAVGVGTASPYKVRMTANGRTFNMLLPPSVESKHPGRSNPLQMPGLQIKAVAAISKTRIPGFFPIYQHLGVDSLMISMSGMFTGYDGTQNLSTGFNWEGWSTLDFKEEQDAAAAISEFYDFAVRNKALVEVIINTSDGSFIPKKTNSTAFRDSQSNIKFKGYVKEFEAVHVRQDRAYYMIKFEVIDLNRKNECRSQDIRYTIPQTALAGVEGLGTNNSPLTPEDISYSTPNDLATVQKLIAKINSKQPISIKELNSISSVPLRAKLAIFADSEGLNTNELYQNIFNNADLNISKEQILRNKERAQYLVNEYITNLSIVCNKLNRDCEDKFRIADRNQKTINDALKSQTNNIVEERRDLSNLKLTLIDEQANIINQTYKDAFENSSYLYGGETIQPKGYNLGNKNIRENRTLYNPDKDSYAYIGNTNIGEPIFQILKDSVVVVNNKRQFTTRTQSTINVIVSKINNPNQISKNEYELLPFTPIK